MLGRIQSLRNNFSIHSGPPRVTVTTGDQDQCFLKERTLVLRLECAWSAAGHNGAVY